MLFAMFEVLTWLGLNKSIKINYLINEAFEKYRCLFLRCTCDDIFGYLYTDIHTDIQTARTVLILTYTSMNTNNVVTLLHFYKITI